MISHDKCAAFEARISQLEKRLEDAEEVIKFYSNYDNYGTTKNVRPRIPWEKRLITSKDVDDSLKGMFPVGGKTARKYFAKYGERK